jgi:hypothetical protein
MARKFLVLMLVLLSVGATAAAKTGQRKKPHKAKAPVVQPVPDPAPTPAPPLTPLTPEQGPSYPPDVSFQGGELTIVARNSTMGDVLTAVKQRTGAAVDMPAVSSERVVGRFGPGAPRDVMAQLLNGSHYDYVLLGSPADPGALKKVVLIARASGPEPAPPQQEGNQPVMQGNPNLQAVPDIANDDQDDNSAEMPAEAQAPEQEEPQPEQQQPGPNGPPIKTPEQLLRELQQQQQQQQQNAPPPGAPPQ